MIVIKSQPFCNNGLNGYIWLFNKHNIYLGFFFEQLGYVCKSVCETVTRSKGNVKYIENERKRQYLNKNPVIININPSLSLNKCSKKSSTFIFDNKSITTNQIVLRVKALEYVLCALVFMSEWEFVCFICVFNFFLFLVHFRYIQLFVIWASKLRPRNIVYSNGCWLLYTSCSLRFHLWSNIHWCKQNTHS